VAVSPAAVMEDPVSKKNLSGQRQNGKTGFPRTGSLVNSKKNQWHIMALEKFSFASHTAH
jgi:hypothetical protein